MDINRRTFLRLGSAVCGLGFVSSYPVCIERNLFQVNRYKIPIRNLPEPFHGFTIVHLTDLHYGFLVSYSFLQKVVRRANGVPRDITVCTGDYIHECNATKQIDTIWPLISTLSAPYGVYSVLGNHDHWADTNRSLYWLDRSKQLLRHKTQCFTRNGKNLWLVGAGDLWEDHVDLDILLNTIPNTDCRIILAHNPDTADTWHSKPVDLFISGHTHGGQVRLPFVGSPVLPVKNKTYSSGLKKSQTGETVYISRGIGWALYPVRFNCYPEIAVLELIPG